jgi:predicted DNA-binding protein
MLVRIPPEVADELRALSRRTRVPLATYQREAMADLVAKYRTRRTSEES